MRWQAGLVISLFLAMAFLLFPRSAVSKTEAQCLAEKKTELDRLKSEFRRLERLKVTSSGGPNVQPGRCTKTVAKIAGSLRNYPFDAATAEHNEKISCVELEILSIERACKCQAKGLEFSLDPKHLDESYAAYARLAAAQKVYRRVLIRNREIRKFVDEASEIRECFSQKTIELLNATADAIERIAREMDAESK
jgi:hypothetical protein